MNADMATTKRISVHDLDGDALAAYTAKHFALYGVPPLAGGAPDPEDENDPGASADTELERARAEAAKWKAMSRKHEAASRENAAAVAELAEIKEQGKSEAQKAADTAAQAEKRASAAEAKLARIEVALAKAPAGMSGDQILKLSKRLSGDSREELESDADELFTDFAPKGKTAEPDTAGENKDAAGDSNDGASTRKRPTEQLTPGGAPDTDPGDSDMDPDKLAAQVPRF